MGCAFDGGEEFDGPTVRAPDWSEERRGGPGIRIQALCDVEVQVLGDVFRATAGRWNQVDTGVGSERFPVVVSQKGNGFPVRRRRRIRQATREAAELFASATGDPNGVEVSDKGQIGIFFGIPGQEDGLAVQGPGRAFHTPIARGDLAQLAAPGGDV